MDTPDPLPTAPGSISQSDTSPPATSNNNNNNDPSTLATDTTPDSLEATPATPTDQPTSTPPLPKTLILTDECVNRLVARAVDTITLECGYHEARQASLDVLADVCRDYIKRMATMLRLAVDTEHWRDPDCDFVDSLERVFHQMNVPSAANLHQFVCRMEAIKKHDRRPS